MGEGFIEGPPPSGGEVVDRYMKATAARSAGAPVYVKMSAGGEWSDGSLADDTSVHYLAVALQDIASGARGRYRLRGKVTLTVPSGTYTNGNGLKLLDGAVADSGGAVTDVGGQAQTTFGITTSGGASVTSITAFLHGCPFTGTT